MEIINPEEEPLDWDKGSKKRRPDHNPWHPGKERNPYEKDPYPSGPFPGDPPDDDWPGRKKDPNPFGPRKRPQDEPHKRWEKPGKKTCPGCGGTGEVHEDHDTPWYGGPTGPLDTHRGQQYGRKGHFGSGHQNPMDWGAAPGSQPRGA